MKYSTQISSKDKQKSIENSSYSYINEKAMVLLMLLSMANDLVFVRASRTMAASEIPFVL